MSASQDGISATIICSGDTSRTVYLDADGKLTHAPAQQSQHEHCAACIHHMPILPVLASEGAPRIALAYALPPVAIEVGTATYPTGLPPRAPPA